MIYTIKKLYNRCRKWTILSKSNILLTFYKCSHISAITTSAIKILDYEVNELVLSRRHKRRHKGRMKYYIIKCNLVK